MSSDKVSVTLLLTTFNQEEYVEASLRSCLAQDYPNLDILISDDCSTDRTFDIIEDICSSYSGNHRITLNRNGTNMYLDHLDHILPMVRGELCILACGDDIQYPHRVRTIVDLWKRTGASILCSTGRIIDEYGIAKYGFQRYFLSPPDLSLKYFLNNGDCALCFGAALSWHKSIPETFGTFGPGIRNFDFLYPLRGILLNGAAFHNEPLLDWRMHTRNTTLHDDISLKITETDPEKRVERLLLRERKILNIIANWHKTIEDAQTVRDKLGRPDDANMLANTALTYIYNLTGRWRLIRHELTNMKVGFY